MSLKTLFLLLSLLFGMLLIQTTQAESLSQVQKSSQTIVLDMQNMTCSLCKFTIKKALSSVTGTEKVSINFEDKTATVIFNPQKTTSKDLIKASTNAGYPATVRSTKK